MIVRPVLGAAPVRAERGDHQADIELLLPADDLAAAHHRHALAIERDRRRGVELEREPLIEREVPRRGEAVDIAGAQSRGLRGRHRRVGEIMGMQLDAGAELIGRARRHADRRRRRPHDPGARERRDESDLALRGPAAGLDARGDVGSEEEEGVELFLLAHRG
ncbi:hypothetical protein PIB19_03920 [Sphingomonas sp. 7/4-4]|uniref:hypothetical protein n=1 Tax=Sphingomonas sp. 7/4-4 TaxID=3018446 RepID=UPI0022F3F4AD|nr:hypothetical protein [Sphingomonas sp. 7/4-4]WBY08625.1 hypothetical protein PIB19_03920 [Sphingomonas sp. 7/4-4]